MLLVKNRRGVRQQDRPSLWAVALLMTVLLVAGFAPAIGQQPAAQAQQPASPSQTTAQAQQPTFAQAQPTPPSDTASLSGFNRFFIPADQPQTGRIIGVSGTIAGLYAGASVALYNYWYRDYELGRFRMFNDNAEWLQMDKGGHVLSAYYETNWAYGLFNWAGMPKGKAIAYAGMTSTVIQLTIEVFDGFSEEWGFSGGDILANTAGTALSMGQQALWDEQRMQLKFSFYPVDYDGIGDPQLVARSEELFGTAFAETLLKDYNGLTYWLSVNPASFSPGLQKARWWPDWLNVALGYGAEGLYGGFDNHWCADAGLKPEQCPEAQLITRYDVPRQRQYFLSLDVDLTRIETQKPFLRTLFGVISVIKVPAPALEYRSGQGFKGHWIYF